MRAALALYAVRFGGWLLARAAGSQVDVTVEFEEWQLRRSYGRA